MLAVDISYNFVMRLGVSRGIWHIIGHIIILEFNFVYSFYAEVFRTNIEKIFVEKISFYSSTRKNTKVFE